MAAKQLWETRCLRLRVALSLPVSQEYLSYHLHGNIPPNGIVLLRKSNASNEICCAAARISLHSRRRSMCLFSSPPCCSSTIFRAWAVTVFFHFPSLPMINSIGFPSRCLLPGWSSCCLHFFCQAKNQLVNDLKGRHILTRMLHSCPECWATVMYRMLVWLPEPITVFDSCKFTRSMSEKFPPFLVENGKEGNPLPVNL